MSLTPSIACAFQHACTLKIEAFIGDDDLWEMEVCPSTKAREFNFPQCNFLVEEPLYGLCLRPISDHPFTIVAEVDPEMAPYRGFYETVELSYSKLIDHSLIGRSPSGFHRGGGGERWWLDIVRGEQPALLQKCAST